MAAKTYGLQSDDDAPPPERRGGSGPHSPRDRKKKKRKPPKGLGARLLKPPLGIAALLAAFVACGGLGYVAVTTLFGGPALIPPERWREQVLADRFKVLLPGLPRPETQERPNGMSVKKFVVRPDGESLYTAAYSEGELPPARAALTIQQLLDDSCDGSFDAMQREDPNVKESSRTAVSIDGHPGKQIVLKISGGRGQVVLRVYWVEGRLFILSCAGKGLTADNANVKYLFDSFKSVPEGERKVKPKVEVAEAPAPPPNPLTVAPPAPPPPPPPPPTDPTLPVIASTLNLTAPDGTPSVGGFRFSPDGKTLMALTGQTGASWFDAATGKSLWTATASETGGRAAQFALSPLADRAAFLPTAGGVALLRRGGVNSVPLPLAAPERGRLEFQRLAFSHDGLSLCASGGPQADGVWDVRTGECRAALVGEPSDSVAANVAAFSPDGELLVTAGTRVVVWDAKTFRRLGELDARDCGTVATVAFAPGGRSVVGVGLREVVVWDLERDREAETVVAARRTRDPLGNVAALDFTPDGKSLVGLVTDGGKRLVRVWDAATLKPRGDLDFTGRNETPAAFAFRPTDSLLAVACGSKVLLLDLTKQPWWE